MIEKEHFLSLEDQQESMGEIEKIEVTKSSGTYYFTGVLTVLEDGWVQINTIRGEVLRFRREQVEDRKVVND